MSQQPFDQQLYLINSYLDRHQLPHAQAGHYASTPVTAAASRTNTSIGTSHPLPPLEQSGHSTSFPHSPGPSQPFDPRVQSGGVEYSQGGFGQQVHQPYQGQGQVHRGQYGQVQQGYYAGNPEQYSHSHSQAGGQYGTAQDQYGHQGYTGTPITSSHHQAAPVQYTDPALYAQGSHTWQQQVARTGTPLQQSPATATAASHYSPYAQPRLQPTPSPSVPASAQIQQPYNGFVQASTVSPDLAQYHAHHQQTIQAQGQVVTPTSIDPALFRTSASPLPPAFADSSLAAPVSAFPSSAVPLDTAQPLVASTDAGLVSPSKPYSAVPKIKLRLNAASRTTTTSPAPLTTAITHLPPQDTTDMPSSRNRGAPAPVYAEQDTSTRSRPSRQAASLAASKTHAALADTDEEEYEEDEPAPSRSRGSDRRVSGASMGGAERRTSGKHVKAEHDAYAYDDPNQLALDDGQRRSTRERKAPQKYAGEDDFEERLAETSPVAPSPQVRSRVGAKKKGRRVIDPDEDDDDYGAGEEGQDEDAIGEEETQTEQFDTPVKPRRAFPPAPAQLAAAPNTRRLSAAHAQAQITNGNGNSNGAYPTRSGGGRPTRSTRKTNQYGDSEDNHSFQPSGSDVGSGSDEESDDVLGRSMGESGDETATSDDDEDSYGKPRRSRAARNQRQRQKQKQQSRRAAPGRSAGTRQSARIKAGAMDDEDDEDYGGGGGRGGGGGGGGGRRNLRERKSQVNYALPPVDISMELAQQEVLGSAALNGAGVGVGGRANGRNSLSGLGAGGAAALANALQARGKSTGARARGLVAGARFGGGGGFAGLGGLGGRDMVRAMGEDTSDSDLDILAPPKAGAGAGAAGTSNAGGMGMAGAGTGPAAPAGGAKIGAPTDVANFGRINPKSSMADADPLGVDMNVTFDNVGGLDDHINQLKEMVALPLLYPEVFQQFGITPPRGVLFHGPPGTGKTLLARALAASCSTGNTKIAFFMRKGADVLSKWVGEAERQLRMLFEEARAAQPSIIFFDEIDGLAPVRSSKQDQIHASLVSTLLALMDGMDGRGQVIVIGATNRPDSVDPALRRPGRFDREFYFPLPNKEARKKIIRINTRTWTPQLGEGMVDRLAGLTKGYGGADMRALCTEAALNAIQRRYPQIYKSTDRFELDTSSIEVKAKDFMMSIKKIVPSSARSTSSTAIPLPPHLVPLLSAPLERIKSKVDDVLPRHKHKTALEEAMFEDDEAELNEEGAVMVQSLDKMRTYRPRLLISGAAGMGQAYLGPAILHHLEGFHVQNLDLGVLLGDSGRTPEAALVQLFVEAKRHQPSIIYVPNLSAWSATLSDSARATFKSLLDGVQPSEPVLLLGVVEEEEVSAEVRSWFGWGGEGDVELSVPSETERGEYFLPLLTHLQTPPTSWPDALPRRPRILEQLPLAAPLPERQRTQAEIDAEHEKDKSAMNMMVLSFTGLLSDWAKRYKRLVLQLRDETFALHQALVELSLQAPPAPPAAITELDGSADLANGEMGEIPEIALQPPTQQVAEEPEPVVLDDTYGAVPAASAAPVDGQPIEPLVEPIVAEAAPVASTSPDWTPYDLDLDKLQLKLIKFKYHRPRDFLDDIDRIKENAEHLGDLDKLNKVAEMTAHAYLHVSEFEPKWMPEFDAFAERMKRRKEQRRAEKVKEKERQEAEKQSEQVEGTIREESAVDAGAGAAAITAPEAEEVPGQTGAKRAREGEDVDMDGRDDVKRSRSDEHAPAVEKSEPDSSLPAAPEATVPPPISSTFSTAEPERATSPPAAVAPPAPVYPPFVIPVERLAELTRSLRTDTAQFSIEQLEQLRAAIFDRIWKKRATWDRTELVLELQQTLGSFVKNVNRVQAARAAV